MTLALLDLRELCGMPRRLLFNTCTYSKEKQSKLRQPEGSHQLLTGAFQQTGLKRDTHNRKQWGSFSFLASEFMLQPCLCGPQWGLREPLAWSCLTHESLVAKKKKKPNHSLNFYSASVHLLTIYFYHRDFKTFMRKWCAQCKEIKFSQTKCIYLLMLFHSLSVFERLRLVSERETTFWRYALSSGWDTSFLKPGFHTGASSSRTFSFLEASTLCLRTTP